MEMDALAVVSRVLMKAADNANVSTHTSLLQLLCSVGVLLQSCLIAVLVGWITVGNGFSVLNHHYNVPCYAALHFARHNTIFSNLL